MHADLSRTTFAAQASYRSVLLQQGRVMLDADFNEQAAITAHHDEARTRDIVGAVGGPLPDDPAQPGPFALRTAAGAVPASTPWASLVVTPGHYYVDGALVESFPPVVGTGWPLDDQPFARPLADPPTPGLGEPPAAAGDRFGLYLEVTEHDVTGDEQPRLLESALGGPDTTVRAQTAWQVKWSPIEDDQTCADLHGDWLRRTPRQMIASVQPPDADADPCRIGSAGGYRRLENQLYRVEIHSPEDGAEPATFLWSRENGSVAAALTAIRPDPDDAAKAIVTVDREGRDPELSIGEGSILELTSTDRRLRRIPGHLATVDAVAGLDLSVTWLTDAPASVAALGRVPIVRRWEGRGSVRTTSQQLEDGILVRFPTGGEPRSGDHWQIPARTVRLAYGLSELRGTIDWPPPGATSSSVDPQGPEPRIAPLGILTRDAGGWTLEHDCRSLFPPLTSMISIDLVGGDGQEDLPGEWLDVPVRIAVRNGGVAVADADVSFAASDGGDVSALDPPVAGDAALTAQTGADGVVAIRWRLDPAGPTTQTLSARRTVDGVGTGVTVVASARLAVASEVAFSRDGCAVFQGVGTVAEALESLADRVELRLQGGDGQLVLQGEAMLRHPIRILADSACGPVGGVPVTARASAGSRVQAVADPSEPWPGSLGGATDIADGSTAPDGGLMFWWQPANRPSDWLEIRLPGDDPRAPIVVTAQWEQVGGIEGAHIVKTAFQDGSEFENDADVRAIALASGIIVAHDRGLSPEMTGKPVLWVELDLPWPIDGDGAVWSPNLVGTRTVRLDGDVVAEGELLLWRPSESCAAWFGPQGQLWSVDATLKGVAGRMVLDGTGTLTEDGLAVNTHVRAVMVDGRVHYELPTDDLTAGGRFVQWFTLQRGLRRRLLMPDFTGMTLSQARKRMLTLGIDNIEIEGAARGRIREQVPPPGEELWTDTAVTFRVGL